MNEVILVGHFHHDPERREYIKKVLGELDPDVVIAEGSEEIIENYKKFMNALREKFSITRLPLRRIKAWLSFIEIAGPTDVITPKEYCEEKNIPFFFFKDTETLYSEKELEGRINILVAAAHKSGPEDELKFQKERASYWYKYYSAILNTNREEGHIQDRIDEGEREVRAGLSTKKGFYDDEHVGPRDREMRDKLLDVMDAHPNKKIVCLLGSGHIFRDPRKKSFYSLIMDLNPSRRMLREK